jgi:hypothetical protein
LHALISSMTDTYRGPNISGISSPNQIAPVSPDSGPGRPRSPAAQIRPRVRRGFEKFLELGAQILNENELAPTGLSDPRSRGNT